jgi:TonB family protein
MHHTKNDVNTSPYILKMGELIHSNYYLPKEMMEKHPDINAELLIKLNPDGSLKSVKIHKSSGTKVYDELCLTAIKKSFPYEKVPEQHKEVLTKAGIIFKFKMHHTKK